MWWLIFYGLKKSKVLPKAVLVVILLNELFKTNGVSKIVLMSMKKIGVLLKHIYCSDKQCFFTSLYKSAILVMQQLAHKAGDLRPQ